MHAQNSLSVGRRAASLSALKLGLYDILVIGGGINGAGVAREAAIRGLKVALVEARDFASGTSSRSSKLIHGGLRYLAQGEIGLVREAAQERQVLRQIAPHLAKPVKMLLPGYGHTHASLVKLSLGLWTFERLASVPAEESYTVLGSSKVRKLEPRLRGDGLRGAVLYYEFVTDDARLVLDTIKGACECGAVAINYVEAVAMRTLKSGESRVKVREIRGGELEVRARCVVNAAGPWLDQVASLEFPAPARLHLTKGIHLVFPRSDLPINHCVVMQARDKRPVFALPLGEVVYLGTTDTDFSGPLDEPPIEAAEVEYLLDAAQRSFPSTHLTVDRLVSTWAGLRPLLHEQGKKPSEISRKDEIAVNKTGLVTVAGGKLTTYRAMARRVVDRILGLPTMSHMKSPQLVASRTHEIPLSGGDLAGADSLASYLREASSTNPLALANAPTRKRLVSTYGSNAPSVTACADGDPALLTPLAAGTELTEAEVRYAIRYEMAATVCDVLERRTRASLFSPGNGLSAAEKVAEVMKRELDWDQEQSSQEVARFRQQVAKARTIHHQTLPPAKVCNA